MFRYITDQAIYGIREFRIFFHLEDLDQMDQRGHILFHA